jgi:hypothetical protein
MPLDRHEPERDLLYPLPPPGERWHHHRVYTNYYGFTLPEHRIGVFTYLRGQPAFPLSHGGVMIFQGLDNIDPLDAEFFDYEISMPWPEITTGDTTTVTTANGLRFDILEPGRRIHLSYTSNDGATSIDVLADAVTPMIARGHVMSGEEDHHEDHHGGERQPGGFEQYMHYTGELVLHGTRYPVDAYDVRDRSWHQLRTERQDAVLAPPMGWTPMRFGDDLTLHHVGFEAPDHGPLWTQVYDIPAERIRPIAGWVYSAADDEALRIVRTHRVVHERDRLMFMPTRQTLEVEDEKGRVLSFTGQALAVGELPMWPNTTMRGAVYRWTDAQARTCHSLTQELWFDRWQRAMKQHRTAQPTGDGADR